MPSSVSAVVLTHRRPRLATAVVRSLIEQEGLPPDRVVVVVNGSGGLEDPTLESSVRLVRLPRNLGPAGGFGAGMEAAFADPSVHWAYLCEDDMGLFSLPSPRLADVVSRAECRGGLSGRPVGAVVAYGRRFVGRGAHTANLVPPAGDPDELVPVDVASWGATLLARRVFDAGILPDPEWFFGLEDFDFFCRVRAGWIRGAGRRACRLGPWPISRRPQAEPGRSDPTDRPTNAKRGGRTTTLGTPYCWPVVMVALRGTCGMRPTRPGICKRPREAERKAILHGLWDGIRGRFGENPDYGRTVGEYFRRRRGSRFPDG